LQEKQNRIIRIINFFIFIIIQYKKRLFKVIYGSKQSYNKKK
jgi:hypothetical protein